MNSTELKALAVVLNAVANGAEWECKWDGNGWGSPLGRDVEYCIVNRIPIRIVGESRGSAMNAYPSKQEIKAWLKRVDRSRTWIGEQCGASLRTVNCWLSSKRPIPPPALHKIAGLMANCNGESTSPMPRGQSGTGPTMTIPIGMSLHDWFAGQALASASIANHIGPNWQSLMADQAYQIADAMLAARSAKEVAR
jgi:hypothetical protein